MFKLIIELIVLYFLFQLIFNFILPIIKISAAVKKDLHSMKKKFDNQSNTNHTPPNKNSNKSNPANEKQVGDYIDYEEIKS